MTDAARRLAQGDYDAPTPTEARGELGMLARAMTHMASEVKTRVGELTQQRDLLQTVLGGLVEGVVVVDKAGTVAFVNKAAFSMVGDASLHPALLPLVDAALAGAPGDAELEIEKRTVRASARPLSDRGAIVVLYDVSQIRALEGVRREFLSNAAHELRTPLTSISGYAETLLGGGVDDETSKEFLEIIHRNAGRITSLVADLVMLDTIGGRATAVSDRAPVEIARVCRDAVRTTKGIAPDARIEVDAPDELTALGTREGLDHVVQNLVDNAVKYGGGTAVRVSAAMHGKRVRIEIADGGPGIPAGQEERVFERFYRLDFGRSRDVGGNGLGLAIVKSQVEAMGGRVWIEPANPGARFIVELDAVATAS
jgi:two-component system phosphate regulon sensor histidine kinase PhoR